MEVKKNHSRYEKRQDGGHCQFAPEMLKGVGSERRKLLTKIFNMALNKGDVQKNWKRQIILPIHERRFGRMWEL